MIVVCFYCRVFKAVKSKPSSKYVFPGIDITVRRLSQTFSYELLLQITNHPDNSRVG